MKNTISIVPADNEMKIFADSLSILNRFKLAGYDTRRTFVCVVGEFDSQYLSHDNILKLYGFWLGRVKDEQLNSDLENILEQLKNKSL